MNRPSRKSKSFQRRHQAKSGDIILIVCEGEKTEPEYFKDLRNRWKLQSARIVICGDECDSAPISVVDFAIEKRREIRKDQEIEIDQTWCVIDYDRHESLRRAINKAEDNHINVALSCPCFEFWYLLHFEFTTRYFQNSSTLCKELTKHLKKFKIKKYDKRNVPFEVLFPMLDTACKNAEDLRKNNEKTGSTNPMTDVDILVQKIRSLKI